ncbi:MAG: ABC-F family ATP-binding cassette domain-containing protein [Bacteroidales bacterium]|nr:ABC-F family ATP-binding cassette domain-containing protein [Bacteroidales bacterium]
MITINNLSIAFNGEKLFDNVSFTIGDKDRIGLVGKNGAGKSTLLKILCNRQQQDSGTVIMSKLQTVGYLPQEMVPSSSVTVLEEAKKAFDEIRQLQLQAEDINKQLLEISDYQSKAYENLLLMQDEINQRLNLADLNNAGPQAEKVLLGLGFKHGDFNRKMTEFSSGWQMRVELAKILLRKPNLILLDEPTNHLDIESITWLESFLQQYYGAVVLVSHDRCFLDNITKRTVEITAGRIYDYKTNYSDYCVLHEQRIQSQQSQMVNQQRQIAEVEKFIERFRYKATKAKQVQSKIKMLDKMERITVDETDTSSVHFLFPKAPHCGKVVVDIKNLNKSYGDKKVLENINFILQRGGKAAFIGRNGEGKSTLSKIIVGEIKDYTGVCNIGYDVKIGYFAQNQAALLDGEKTVFETIDDIATGDSRMKIRSILGSFLFDNEAIEKKVKVLSGGEKTRLALAKLLLSQFNLLVLDEPTNHLDLVSKDILKNALIKYDGAFIIVSHDRDFLEGLTDTLYEFKDRSVKEYHDDIYSFLEKKKLQSLDELNLKQSAEKKEEKTLSQSKLDFIANKEKEKELRKKRNRLSAIEKEIELTETEIKRMESLLDTQQTAQFFTDYQKQKELLEDLMQQWEDISQQLEN